MGKRERPEGETAFHARYAGLYGDRWPLLARALGERPDSVPFRVRPDSEPYYLDAASLLAGTSLDLPQGGAEGEDPLVLDACAAPGGKSLILAARIGRECGNEVRLVSNELSADRRRRLAEVLDRHLPADLRARVELSGRDASSLCRTRAGRFDAILLDAPCSSERHVLADPGALAEWSPARSRNLAVRQWALLSSAFLMLKPGACLVYSTCSLAPEENQDLVRRLEKKYALRFRYEALEDERAEAAGPGILILPDRARGAGPMFICRIRKLAGEGPESARELGAE